jgi:transposase
MVSVKSRTLVKLGQDWQETIRRIVALEKEMED